MESVKIVWIVIGLLLAGGIFYYAYQKYFKIDKQFVPNHEYVEEPIRYECILFYTTWCPHCKKTLKDWREYTSMNESEYATYTTVDCDKQKDKAELYEIDSYPTVILLYKEKKYIFDSNFSKEAMDKFIHTILKI